MKLGHTKKAIMYGDSIFILFLGRMCDAFSFVGCHGVSKLKPSYDLFLYTCFSYFVYASSPQKRLKATLG